MQWKQEKVGQSKEDGKDFRVRLRGCIYFLGGDCIIEEVTFEQRDEELSKELSGEEDRARRKATEWECAWSV